MKKRPAAIIGTGVVAVATAGIIGAVVTTSGHHDAAAGAAPVVHNQPIIDAQIQPAAGPGVAPLTAAQSSSAGSTKAANAPSKTTKVLGQQSITYVVKPGDNLTVIAAWFKLHGYGDLYAQNRAVIGENPNLIFPGQRITITKSGQVTMSQRAQ